MKITTKKAHATILAIGVAMIMPVSAAITVFSDNFNNGDTADGWILDYASRMGSTDYGSGGQLVAVTANAQPAGLWHTFTDTTLADGQILRLTVDVMMSRSTAQNRSIRFGLGYAADPISNGNVAGYQWGMSHNGSNADPMVDWLASPSNWGNATTTSHGSMLLDDNDLYTVNNSEMCTVQIDLERSGTDYISQVTINSGVSGTTTWSSAGEIADFKFNAVGLFTPYNNGETWTYDNVTVEVIPEPSAGILLGLGALALTLRRRR